MSKPLALLMRRKGELMDTIDQLEHSTDPDSVAALRLAMSLLRVVHHKMQIIEHRNLDTQHKEYDMQTDPNITSWWPLAYRDKDGQAVRLHKAVIKRHYTIQAGQAYAWSATVFLNALHGNTGVNDKYQVVQSRHRFRNIETATAWCGRIARGATTQARND